MYFKYKIHTYYYALVITITLLCKKDAGNKEVVPVVVFSHEESRRTSSFSVCTYYCALSCINDQSTITHAMPYTTFTLDFMFVMWCDNTNFFPWLDFAFLLDEGKKDEDEGGNELQRKLSFLFSQTYLRLFGLFKKKERKIVSTSTNPLTRENSMHSANQGNMLCRWIREKKKRKQSFKEKNDGIKK